ncbi:MAG TPA: hypothetical protein VNG34_08910, partial [Actinomycetota bacterium]|nr:hypothetical protein [Actinomycetota bacterium]
VELATGQATRLTATPAYDHQVAWFPDSSAVVLERAKFVTATIVSVDADGSDQSALTSGHFDADPAPSPTGSTIVFASDRIGGFLPDLWLMQAEGASPHVILDLPFASTTPDWQPVPVPGRDT